MSISQKKKIKSRKNIMKLRVNSIPFYILNHDSYFQPFQLGWVPQFFIDIGFMGGQKKFIGYLRDHAKTIE